MAAFSSSSTFQQQHPFLHLPNSNCFSQFLQADDEIIYPHIDVIDEQKLISSTQVSSCSNKMMNSTTHVDSSSIVTSDDITIQKELIITNNNNPTLDNNNNNNKRKSKHPTQSKDKREGKRQKKMKDDKEKKLENIEEGEAAKYIHVRARRGQATDSHSLAERVRREKISERMKLLQSLVPGCDKITGKALMLDQIINYVQSLQNQVEFLSMKLASLNPHFYDFGLDLESFVLTPHQHLSELPSPLANMEECSPTAANDYHVLENSLVFQQPLVPNVFPQGSRETMWEVDEHRQKIMNESSSSLFSFH